MISVFLTESRCHHRATESACRFLLRTVLHAVPVLFFLMALALPALAHFGKLTVASGSVTVLRGEQKIFVKEGETISLVNGDEIWTADGAKAEITAARERYGGGVVISANSKVRVHEVALRSTRPPLLMLLGALRIRISQLLGEQPILRTPTSTFGIKGTDFIVSMDAEQKNEIIGIEGKIEAGSSDHPDDPAYKVVVGARQMSRIAKGAPPEPPVHVPDDIWFAALRQFSFQGEPPVEEPHPLINRPQADGPQEPQAHPVLKPEAAQSTPAEHTLLQPSGETTPPEHSLLR